MLWPVSHVQKEIGEAASHNHGLHAVERLLFDGSEVSSDVRLVNWGNGCFQMLVCEFCGSEGCASGSWLSLRRAADGILWMPAFDRLEVSPRSLSWLPPEEEPGSHAPLPFNHIWLEETYRPPDYVFAKGIPLLDQERYSRARSLVPALPRSREIRPLSAREAVRVMQWDSPRSAWAWSQGRERAEQAAFVATTGDKLESEIRRLESLLEGWVECQGPVSVTTAVPEDEPLTFILNTFEFPEWSPLVVRDGVPGLYVQPGYVITE